MPDDALGYEAAQVVGISNALNVVADALGEIGAGFTAVDPGEADGETRTLFAEIAAFYESTQVPMPFRLLAHDPGYASDVWGAARHAFPDHRLSRRPQEALALAVSVTSRSRFGTAFHLAEMRRLGVGERGVMEVLGVTQMFSSYTKIADTLQLDPDMGDIAPVDHSPAPGGPPAPAARRPRGDAQVKGTSRAKISKGDRRRGPRGLPVRRSPPPRPRPCGA